MMRIFPVLALLALSACSNVELVATPTTLDFGTIDFMLDLPQTGYDSREIILRNDGDDPIDVSISNFDTSHLLLTALLAVDNPPTLFTIDAGNTNVLQVGVLAYDVGERDSELTGEFSLIAEGLKEPVVIEWSFTPTRNQ